MAGRINIYDQPNVVTLPVKPMVNCLNFMTFQNFSVRRADKAL